MAQPGGGWRNMPPDSIATRTTAVMADSLNLSAAQLAKVQEVNLSFAQKQSEIRATHEGDWENMRGAMQQLRKEKEVELGKYLTTDQMNKWTMVQQNRRGHREKRRGDKKKKRSEQR